MVGVNTTTLLPISDVTNLPYKSDQADITVNTKHYLWVYNLLSMCVCVHVCLKSQWQGW